MGKKEDIRKHRRMLSGLVGITLLSTIIFSNLLVFAEEETPEIQSETPTLVPTQTITPVVTPTFTVAPTVKPTPTEKPENQLEENVEVQRSINAGGSNLFFFDGKDGLAYEVEVESNLSLSVNTLCKTAQYLTG